MLSTLEPARERRLSITIGPDVSIAAIGLAGPTPPKALLFCVPGGGMSKEFWHLSRDGADWSQSFAAHMVSLGFAVIALDNPGTGESGSSVPAPMELLDVATQNSSVLPLAQAELGIGDCPVIGVGHSFGALLVSIQQAEFRDFDAVALLGYSHNELVVPLADGTFRRIDDQRTEEDMARMLFGPFATDPEVSRSLARARTSLPVAEATILTPAIARDRAAAIDVPVFSGFSEYDNSRDPYGDAAVYASARSVTSFVLPGAGHCFVVSTNLPALCRRLAAWVEELSLEP
jgi:pimeloyl-ACP methyl ester carboxylesterase